MAEAALIEELLLPVSLSPQPQISWWHVLLAGTGFGVYMLWRHIWMLDTAERLRRHQKQRQATQQRAAAAASGLSDPALLPCLYDAQPSHSSTSLCAVDWTFKAQHCTRVTDFADFEVCAEDDSVVRWLRLRGLAVAYICRPVEGVPGEVKMVAAGAVRLAVSRGWSGSHLGSVSMSVLIDREAVTLTARDFSDIDLLLPPQSPLIHTTRVGFIDPSLAARVPASALEAVPLSADAFNQMLAAGSLLARLTTEAEIQWRKEVFAGNYSLKVWYLPNLWELASSLVRRLLAWMGPAECPMETAYLRWKSALGKVLEVCGKADVSVVCASSDFGLSGRFYCQEGLTLASAQLPRCRVSLLGSAAACRHALSVLPVYNRGAA